MVRRNRRQASPHMVGFVRGPQHARKEFGGFKVSQDVYIEIFGKIETAEALKAIAEAAADAGGTDWGTFLEDADVAAREIIAAADAGGSFALMRNDVGRLFPGVTAACREHGVSYVLQSGEAGGEGYDYQESWGPGMDRPFSGSIDGGIPHVPLHEVREAAAKGVEAVRDLVETIERNTFYHVTDRRIEVSPEAREAFAAAAPGA